MNSRRRGDGGLKRCVSDHGGGTKPSRSVPTDACCRTGIGKQSRPRGSQLRPPASREPLQHAGPALFDLDALEAHIDAFSENHTENVRVRRLDEDALIEAVADALAAE